MFVIPDCDQALFWIPAYAGMTMCGRDDEGAQRAVAARVSA